MIAKISISGSESGDALLKTSQQPGFSVMLLLVVLYFRFSGE